MLAKKIVFVLILMFMDGSYACYYMHSTDRQRHPSKYDCLSLLELLEFKIEIDYCRRDLGEQVPIGPEKENRRCFNSVALTFTELRAQRISSYDLLTWCAPITVIDQYQLFLDNNATTMDLNFWCNCSRKTFGLRCEYTFEMYQLVDEEAVDLFAANPFSFISQQYIKHKGRTSDYRWTVTNGTCYMGLFECSRNRIICLHWSQICDGQYSYLE